MHSYIEIDHFRPRAIYRSINDLMPLIDKSMEDKGVASAFGPEKAEVIRKRVVECMKVYYRLIGVDDDLLGGGGGQYPAGVLPLFTHSIMHYFRELDAQMPRTDEMESLRHSGVESVKIRYKYTDSVIKKLVKISMKDPELLIDPLGVFLKGGALHDLVGILFVCSYPYEKEWIARALYSFFQFPYRTDDHLLYGFYTVEKQSGYRALHCDHSTFYPRFDPLFSTEKEYGKPDPERLFDSIGKEDGYREILRKLRGFFNVEIQLHTAFENLWASMEHSNSYNIQAKGIGRNSRIAAQWKLLSDSMKNIEEQFERLQVETEQALFETNHHRGYIPAEEFMKILGSDTYPVFADITKRVEDLEDLLINHEISRYDYVRQLKNEIGRADGFAKSSDDPTIQVIFGIKSAFIYYGLANQSRYFNTYDIRQFVKESMKRYGEISDMLLTSENVRYRDMLNVVAIFRYLYLGQKYGMGLFNPPAEFFSEEENPIVPYEDMLGFFIRGIELLDDISKEEIDLLSLDGDSLIKIIYQYDLMAREWELFNGQIPGDGNDFVSEKIAIFRNRYIVSGLKKHFDELLIANEVKNVGFVVRFYTMLIWHGFIDPTDALKQIVRYSAYDKIKSSELFHYELSAYRYSTANCSRYGEAQRRHLENFHIKNMIRLLFRIKRNESAYKFYECRLYFEQLTKSRFVINHFSETIRR